MGSGGSHGKYRPSPEMTDSNVLLKRNAELELSAALLFALIMESDCSWETKGEANAIFKRVSGDFQNKPEST